MTLTTEQERLGFIAGYRGMISAILLLRDTGKLGEAEALQRMAHCRERIEYYENCAKT